MQIFSKKKYLVFDLDNTLINRDQAMLMCIENVFEILLSIDQKKEIKKQDKEGHSDRIIFCHWLKFFLKIEKNKHAIWDLIKSNIGYFVSLNHDAKNTLKELKVKYELVLLTNGGTENQRRKIKQTGLNEFFPEERIFISEELGYSKPDLQIFQQVEIKLGKENQYCMIGDHFENDIVGAQIYGWQSIYLSQKKENILKEVVVSISSLSKLNKALNELRY